LANEFCLLSGVDRQSCRAYGAIFGWFSYSAS